MSLLLNYFSFRNKNQVRKLSRVVKARFFFLLVVDSLRFSNRGSFHKHIYSLIDGEASDFIFLWVVCLLSQDNSTRGFFFFFSSTTNRPLTPFNGFIFGESWMLFDRFLASWPLKLVWRWHVKWLAVSTGWDTGFLKPQSSVNWWSVTLTSKGHGWVNKTTYIIWTCAMDLMDLTTILYKMSDWALDCHADGMEWMI